MAKGKKKEYMMQMPENVESEMVSLAFAQAKTQLLNGTAPASTVNYFLKLGGSREHIEREMLKRQTELLEAKANNIKNSEDEKQAYYDAIDAIKSYGYNRNVN